MEEKIIVVAKSTATSIKQEALIKQKRSLMGVVSPLIIPASILIYMLVEEVKFRYLESVARFSFWVCVASTVIAFFLYQKETQVENDKVKKAEQIVAKQSLIVTDQRIYGHDEQAPFSYAYSEVAKAYSTTVLGSQPQLNVKLCNGSSLTFLYVEDLQTIISCINDAKSNSQKED